MNLEELQRNQNKIQRKRYQAYFIKHSNNIYLSQANSHILLRSVAGFLQHYTIQPKSDNHFLKHVNQLHYLGLINTKVSNINYRNQIKVIPTKLGKELIKHTKHESAQQIRTKLTHKDIRHKILTRIGIGLGIIFIIIALFDLWSMVNTQIQIEFYPEVNMSFFMLFVLGLVGITLYTYITGDAIKYSPKITAKQLIKDYSQYYNQSEVQQERQRMQHEFLQDIKAEKKHQKDGLVNTIPTCF